MKNFSKQPSALRQVAGFILTGIAISLTVGFAFVAVIMFSGRPIDGWAPTDSVLGGFLVTALALPFVFVGQTVFGIPALIAARRHNLLLHPVITAGFGSIVGTVASGCLVIPLMGRDFVDITLLVLLGAASGLVGGLIWWFLVERHFVWSWNV